MFGKALNYFLRFLSSEVTNKLIYTRKVETFSFIPTDGPHLNQEGESYFYIRMFSHLNYNC